MFTCDSGFFPIFVVKKSFFHKIEVGVFLLLTVAFNLWLFTDYISFYGFLGFVVLFVLSHILNLKFSYSNITKAQVEKALQKNFGFLNKNNLLHLFCANCIETHYETAKMESFDLIMASGVDVNKLDKNGNTPLIVLSENSCFFRIKRNEWKKILEKFISAGADINFKNQNTGNTVFHAFLNPDQFVHLYSEFFEVLLELDGDPYIKNKNGETIFDILNEEQSGENYLRVHTARLISEALERSDIFKQRKFADLQCSNHLPEMTFSF